MQGGSQGGLRSRSASYPLKSIRAATSNVRMTIDVTVRRHSHVSFWRSRGSAGTMPPEGLGDCRTGMRDFDKRRVVYLPDRHRCSKTYPHGRMSGICDCANDSRTRVDRKPTCSCVPFLFRGDVLLGSFGGAVDLILFGEPQDDFLPASQARQKLDQPEAEVLEPASDGLAAVNAGKG